MRTPTPGRGTVSCPAPARGLAGVSQLPRGRPCHEPWRVRFLEPTEDEQEPAMTPADTPIALGCGHAGPPSRAAPRASARSGRPSRARLRHRRARRRGLSQFRPMRWRRRRWNRAAPVSGVLVCRHRRHRHGGRRSAAMQRVRACRRCTARPKRRGWRGPGDASIGTSAGARIIGRSETALTMRCAPSRLPHTLRRRPRAIAAWPSFFPRRPARMTDQSRPCRGGPLLHRPGGVEDRPEIAAAWRRNSPVGRTGSSSSRRAEPI